MTNYFMINYSRGTLICASILEMCLSKCKFSGKCAILNIVKILMVSSERLACSPIWDFQFLILMYLRTSERELANMTGRN